MAFLYSDNSLNNLYAALSVPRLARYLAATSGDLHKAITLHEWNSKLAASLHIPMQSFELVLRNALTIQLERLYGPAWYDSVDPFLDTHWQDSLGKIKTKLRRLGRASFTAGDIIANTTFGYWVALMDSRHDRRWWRFCLQRGFPNGTAGFSRSAVHSITKDLNFLRNRIAHHEPIYTIPLNQRYQDLLRVVNWISPDAKDWTEHHSGEFQTLWNNHP